MTVVNQPLTLQFNGAGAQTLSNSDGSAVTSTTNANLIVITTPQAGPPVPIDRADVPLDLSANVTNASAGPFPQVPTIVPSDAQNEGTILSPYSVSEPPGAIVVASGPPLVTPAPFSPLDIPAVTGWLHNTALSGGISSLIDQLYRTNPAVPRSPGNPPTGNANGSMSFDGTQAFLWPPAGNNFNTVRWGYAFWIKFTSLAPAESDFLTNRNGANVIKLLTGPTGGISAVIWSNAGISRTASSASTGLFVANTAAFFTIEYDGNQALESDRCIITTNNVKRALNFSTDTTMPAICATPVGNFEFGDQGGGGFIIGQYGQDIWTLQGAGGLAGGGLVTSDQRAQLMNYAPLT